tara:strand:- start:890 stop:1708 length:819 start_codon:yes stop_codon:yes gene_type:complete
MQNISIWPIIIIVILSSSATGNTLSIRGEFLQGGLIVGQTKPAAVVMLDKKKIMVGTNGRFIFGFGRNAKKIWKLLVLFPNGQKLRKNLQIRERKYRIQKIDGLPSNMVTPSKRELRRIMIEGNAIRSARAIASGSTYFEGGFIWPLKGKITGVYGSQRILNGKPRKPHLGIDIAAPLGTKIVASAKGRVTLARGNLYFTGGTIVIDHGFGLSTVYSHLHKISVFKGKVVEQGQKIGEVGSTGRSTGAHLDWRLNWFQERLDPILVVGGIAK